MEENDFPLGLRNKHRDSGHEGNITVCEKCKQELEWLLERKNTVPVAVRIISTRPYSQLSKT